MTLQQLLDAGVTEPQARAILKIHKETLDGNYVPKERFNGVNEDLKVLKETVKDRDAQLTEIGKKVKDVEGMEDTISKLQAENKLQADKFAAESALNNKKAALKIQLLADPSGQPYDVDMAAGLFNLENITLNEDGTIKSGYKEQSDSIRKEKTFIFKTGQTEEQSGKGEPNNQPQPNSWWKPVGSEPAEGGSGKQVTPEQKSASFGQHMAARKNQMSGRKPITPEQTQSK